MSDGDGVSVRMLEDAADAAAFRALNEEWIARYFVLEERDHRQLGNPVAAYIDTGGAILIAELEGRPIGCVALAPAGTGAWELSKMAVSPELRGHGIGRTLLAAAVAHARGLGARSVFLGTSRKLPSAVLSMRPSASVTSLGRRCAWPPLASTSSWNSRSAERRPARAQSESRSRRPRQRRRDRISRRVTAEAVPVGPRVGYG